MNQNLTDADIHYQHALEALRHWQEVAAMYKVEIDKLGGINADLIQRIDQLKLELAELEQQPDKRDERPDG